jgi:hypothetical protein
MRIVTVHAAACLSSEADLLQPFQRIQVALQGRQEGGHNFGRHVRAAAAAEQLVESSASCATDSWRVVAQRLLHRGDQATVVAASGEAHAC